MAAHHGSDLPPAVGKNSVGLMQDPGQDKKKSKYGALGNTMAHSAAGDVGFGAGKGVAVVLVLVADCSSRKCSWRWTGPSHFLGLLSVRPLYSSIYGSAKRRKSIISGYPP
jgi:hypothetical protein